MNLASTVIVFLSVLFPVKTWVAPDQGILVNVKSPVEVTLVLTDFSGKPFESTIGDAIASETTVNLRERFQTLAFPGTYVLYAVPKGKSLGEFVGTPIVVIVKQDRRVGAPTSPLVVQLEPLKYAEVETSGGKLNVAFYYDVAPNTTLNFLRLAEGGYYDGLKFHRLVPGYVLQGGDPRGDGTGGPGYFIDQEFNERPHVAGVLSMARQGDPLEAQGAMPRSDAANSAGSQFFLCLDYNKTRQLDRRYTAFAIVTDGMGVVESLAKTPVAGPDNDSPTTPIVIKSVTIKPVTATENPYVDLIKKAVPATQESPSKN